MVVVSVVVLEEDDGDKVKKDSIQPLKEKVADQDGLGETGQKAMVLKMKGKAAKVVKAKVEEDSIADFSDVEVPGHDQGQKEVEVKEALMVKRVETMVLQTEVNGKIDLEDRTDHLDPDEKEVVAAVAVEEEDHAVMGSNVLVAEEEQEAVDEVEIVVHAVEVAKKVERVAKARLNRYVVDSILSPYSTIH